MSGLVSVSQLQEVIMGKKFYSVLDGITAVFALCIVSSGLNMHMILTQEGNPIAKAVMTIASLVLIAACSYGIYDVISEKCKKSA